MPRADNPLIIQSDFTILAEVDSPRYAEARAALARFAELVKMPEHVHTYRLTPLSLWNACAAGLTSGDMIGVLEEFAKYALPASVPVQIRETAGRFGMIVLERENDGALVLRTCDAVLGEELARQPSLAALLGARTGGDAFRVEAPWRGPLKRALVKLGWPVLDCAGFSAGAPLACALRTTTREGREFSLRGYQQEAAAHFAERGAGVVVLPCGAGKTVIGLAAMVAAGTDTLILATNIMAARQWIREALDKTTLREEDIGEFSGERKELRPVTVATYQSLTHRTAKKRSRIPAPAEGAVAPKGTGAIEILPPEENEAGAESADGAFSHFSVFDARPWGLIIYDEVHLLPAPLFQAAASVQARRRLGLTATLVREDGLEGDVFALIGPKVHEVPWRELEGAGWIAPAVCTELRVPMAEARLMDYVTASPREKPRVAAENPAKLPLVRALLQRHAADQLLLIGTYVEHLQALAAELGLPLLDGSASQRKREDLFGKFRRGEIRALAVSKIANFSIDLPDASVAIQVSGQFGSRQEEAQRLGRLLRPKAAGQRAFFYTLVSRDTVEQDFALHRQLFLCEQGYEYDLHLLEEGSALPAPPN